MSIKATLNGLSGLHTYVHMFVIIIEEYCWDGGEWDIRGVVSKRVRRLKRCKHRSNMEFPKLTIMKEKSKDNINPKTFNEGNKSSHDFKQWIDIFYIQKK